MRGIAILVLQERKVLFRAKLQILTTKRLAWQGWAGLARLDPVGSDAPVGNFAQSNGTRPLNYG